MASGSKKSLKTSSVEHGEEPKPVTIKKYANRRLYNTATSSYVTLDSLARMVKDGEDFSVFDAKTGEDITRSVLTQIIFEEEAKGENLLPINFLRHLIGFYGNNMQGFVPSYLDMSIENLARQQAEFGRAFGGEAAIKAMKSMTQKNAEMFQNTMKMFKPFGPAPFPGLTGSTAEASGEEAAPSPDRTDELDELRAQMEQMRATLEAMTRKDD